MRTVKLTPDELDLAEQLALSIVLRGKPQAVVPEREVTDSDKDDLVRALAIGENTSRTHSQMCPYHRQGQVGDDVVLMCNCWRLDELKTLAARVTAAGWGPRS